MGDKDGAGEGGKEWGGGQQGQGLWSGEEGQGSRTGWGGDKEGGRTGVSWFSVAQGGDCLCALGQVTKHCDLPKNSGWGGRSGQSPGVGGVPSLALPPRVL